MSDSSLLALTADVDHFLAKADALKYGDHDQLLVAAQSASSRAQKLGDFRRYAQALTHQAWAYVNLNRYEASLTCVLEGLLLARTHGYIDIEARVAGIISFNFLRCGIYDDAVHLYEHQLELGEQLQNGEIQALALNDLGLLKLNTGDLDTSLELLQRALQLMPSDIHQGIDYCIVHLNLAIAYINAKRLDEAFTHAQRILELNIDAPRLNADAHLCMASIYLSHDELEKANAQLEIARALLESTLPSIYNDNLDQLTAELLMHEGHYQQAAQVWESAYETALRRQALDFAVDDLNSLKVVYGKLNDSAGMLSVYKRLSEDIPRLQKQGGDLRFAVLRMVFALDKAALQAQLQLTMQRGAILERLSHEFRTPLAIIQSSADMMAKHHEKMTLEQRQQRLQRITDQVQRLTLMLEDIIELLYLDKNEHIALIQEPFQLDELTQHTMSALNRYHVPAEKIRIRIQSDTGILYGSQKALVMVLVHLLTNAIKFSKEKVTLDLSVEQHALVLCVADQGIGIPTEEQEIVFKPLVRGSNLNEVGGIGIGLSVAAKVVEQMRGTIELTSVEGMGTMVTVRVPLSFS